MKQVVIVFVLLLVSQLSFSQKKVKYKDLYPLLQSRDYVTAEPLLDQFLTNNDDHANAYYYKGELLAGKLDSTEIFPDGIVFDSIADKAKAYYRKSIALIDDKEVRKNDEFYMAYNRRDLRTGKFGIKVSDVHLDIENKIEDLAKRQANIDEIIEERKHINLLKEAIQDSLQAIYSVYPNEAVFLMRSNAEIVGSLQVVSEQYATLLAEVNDYVKRMQALDNPQYTFSLEEIAIQDWDEVAEFSVDLGSNSITLLNVAEWTDQMRQQINEVIIPLKQKLSDQITSFNSAKETNRKASSEQELVNVTVDATIKQELAAYDPDLLGYKVLVLERLLVKNEALSNYKVNTQLLDSTDVFHRVNGLHEMDSIYELSRSMVKNVRELSTEEKLKDYLFLMTSYDQPFQTYLQQQETLLSVKYDSIHTLYTTIKNQYDWFVGEHDTIARNYEIAQTYGGVTNYATDVYEADSMLMFVGMADTIPFYGSAQFNMNLNKIILSDSVANTAQLEPLSNDQFLLIAYADGKGADIVHRVTKFSKDLEQSWSLQITAPTEVTSTKEVGGILFLYNKEEEVVCSINPSGEIIAN